MIDISISNSISECFTSDFLCLYNNRPGWAARESRYSPGLCLPCELLIIVCRKLSILLSSHSISHCQVQVELVQGLELRLALQQPAATQLNAVRLLVPHLHDGQHAAVAKVQILRRPGVRAPQEASVHSLPIHQEEVGLRRAKDEGQCWSGRDADTWRGASDRE